MTSDSSAIWALIVGFVLGLFVMGMAKTYFGDYATKPLMDARKVCEQSLPRDQVCVVNYIPKKEKS